MRLDNRYLRHSVEVQFRPATVGLRFSVWELELPGPAVRGSAHLCAFLRREAPARALRWAEPWAQRLLLWLEQQGCLVPPTRRSRYRLHEVQALWLSFCHEQYGRYYAHPLWEALRQDSVPPALLRQWAARTYFLSRHAGVTAATAALHAPTEAVRQAFHKSAVEEYAHCQEHYALPPRLFDGDAPPADTIAPAGSWTAFDLCMRRAAHEDWLAHLFVALFQERTAGFRQEADQLYGRLERQLDAPGMFDPWRAHIGFDAAHAHEQDLLALFEQPLFVPAQALQASFETAQHVIEALMAGLDDVLHRGRSGIALRLRPDGPVLRPCHLAGLEALAPALIGPLHAGTAAGLVSDIVARVVGIPDGRLLCERLGTMLGPALAESLPAMACAHVSSCQTQAQILQAGLLLRLCPGPSAAGPMPPGLATLQAWLLHPGACAWARHLRLSVTLGLLAQGRAADAQPWRQALARVCQGLWADDTPLPEAMRAGQAVGEVLDTLELLLHLARPHPPRREAPRFALAHEDEKGQAAR